jgi:hypothetical protein
VIVQALGRINDHVMRWFGVSRQHLFQRPALASLLAEDYSSPKGFVMTSAELGSGSDAFERRSRSISVICSSTN